MRKTGVLEVCVIVVGVYLAILNTSCRSGRSDRAEGRTGGDSCLTQPDYHPVFLTCSVQSAQIGDTVIVSESISNLCRTATVQSTVKIYICTNVNNLTCQWPLSTHTTVPLAKGATSWWSSSLTIPNCAKAGFQNYIVCVADANNNLSEFDEGNNKRYIPIMINNP